MEGNSGMKKYLLISLTILLAVVLTACAGKSSVEVQSADGTSGAEQQALPENNGSDQENDAMQKNELRLSINGQEAEVSWEEEKAVDELAEYARSGKITVNTSLYGGFEQVGSLPQSFTRNDVQDDGAAPRISSWYSGNQLVLFFGKNSWSYTKLGHIEGLSDDEITELLGGNTAVIEIEMK